MADALETGSNLPELAVEVLELAKRANVKLVAAESLTGGLLASTLVSVPGASQVFLGGVVAYASTAKESLLGVSAEDLETHGAVSAETAIAMASGVSQRLSSAAGGELLAISTTGVAGPDTQDGKPVGTVFLALSGAASAVAVKRQLSGDRTQIREGAVMAALTLLRDELISRLGL